MDNVEEIRKLAGESMTWGSYLGVIEAKIAEAHETLHNQTAELERVRTAKAATDTRLKELGFHDAGHARGELAKAGLING